MELQPRPVNYKAIIASTIALPLIAVALLMISLDVSWAVLTDAVLESFRSNPADAVEIVSVLLLGVAGGWGMLKFQRHARLVIDSGHIALQSGLPRWLSRWMDWSMDHDDIKRAELRPVGYGNFLMLILIPLEGHPRQLSPEQWIEPGGSRAGRLFRVHKLNETDAAQMLENAPLLRYLCNAGVSVEVNMNPWSHVSGKQVDLSRNRSAMAGILIMALLGVYALIDGVLVQGDAYAGTAPYVLFAAFGLIMAVAATIWFIRALLPPVESIGLALLLGVFAAFAAWPGILRLNALTDTDGAETYTYTLFPGHVLRPEQADLPILNRPIDNQFWSRQPVGSRWQFEMRRGMFGFWQYDTEPVIETIRGYYEKQPA